MTTPPESERAELVEKVQKLLDLIDRAAPRGWREHADPDGDYEAARALLARIRGGA